MSSGCSAGRQNRIRGHAPVCRPRLFTYIAVAATYIHPRNIKKIHSRFDRTVRYTVYEPYITVYVYMLSERTRPSLRDRTRGQ